jgi:hypothetical protein
MQRLLNLLCRALVEKERDFFPSLAEKSQISYDKQPAKRKTMMLVQTPLWETFSSNLIREFFPTYQNNPKLVKELIFMMEPWKGEFVYDERHPLVQKFLNTIPPVPVYASYIRWWVFGCPLSTDIDVLCEVEHPDDVFKTPCVEQLKQELMSFGYPDKELDISLFYPEKDRLSVSKGGQEIINIVLDTYRYHSQKYPCPFTQPIVPTTVDKALVLAKYFLNFLEFLLPSRYKELKDEKASAFQGKWNRLDFTLKYLTTITYLDTPSFKDIVKSLTMKILQFLLLEKGILCYTKEGLASYFDREPVLFLLTRGKMGTYNQQTLPYLCKKFVKHASKLEREVLVWKDLSMNLSNPTLLSDSLYEDFLLHPEEPTAWFCQEFKQFGKIDNIVDAKTYNIEYLPVELQKRVLTCPQRSVEWKEALRYYTCGKNTGVLPCPADEDWVSFYYNLIRGTIVESMIANTDFSSIFPHRKITKVEVGLVVDELKEKARGCAPDMLLLVDDELIPCEFKCVVSDIVDNKTYRRAVSLARRQVESAISIINQPNCKQGLVVVCYVWNGTYRCQYTFFPN